MKLTPGDRVRVVKGGDETFDRRYIGRVGVVTQLQTGARGGPSVGESPSDPFIFVRFPNGVVDGFWQEELKRR